MKFLRFYPKKKFLLSPKEFRHSFSSKYYLFSLKISYFEFENSLINLSFREGVTMWLGNTGFYYDNGRFALQKNIENNVKNFVSDAVNLLSFPCVIYIDYAGFMKSEKEKIFTFPSAATCLQLINEKDSYLLIDSDSKSYFKNFWNSLSDAEILNRWFDAHDSVSYLSSSGLTSDRLLSVSLYVSYNIKNEEKL